MSENLAKNRDLFPQHLEVFSPDKQISANVWITASDQGFLEAQASLEAPKRGDEIMSLVRDQLLGIAKKFQVPVVHSFTASNPAAEKLVKRTEGYRRVGNAPNGLPIYEKTYLP